MIFPLWLVFVIAWLFISLFRSAPVVWFDSFVPVSDLRSEKVHPRINRPKKFNRLNFFRLLRRFATPELLSSDISAARSSQQPASASGTERAIRLGQQLSAAAGIEKWTSSITGSPGLTWGAASPASPASSASSVSFAASD